MASPSVITTLGQTFALLSNNSSFAVDEAAVSRDGLAIKTSRTRIQLTSNGHVLGSSTLAVPSVRNFAVPVFTAPC